MVSAGDLSVLFASRKPRGAANNGLGVQTGLRFPRAQFKRFRRSLTAVAEWCQEHRHAPVDEQQKTLNAKLRSHYQYYGRPTNSQSLLRFYRGVVRIWRKWLNRRTRGNRLTWE